ncbi:hypothetical protein [Spiroplasma sp. ChiS]|nr:hypothetical protein [Spiroplasma sp. ChiS]
MERKLTMTEKHKYKTIEKVINNVSCKMKFAKTTLVKGLFFYLKNNLTI